MAEPAAPRLSLLCCTVGRTEKLGRLLASLARQTFRDFELVVVDQNEPGALDPVLAPYLEQLDIRHVRSARGLSRARNVGLTHCRATIVAFPDDDCWYPDALAEHIVALFDADMDAGVITGRTVDAAGADSLGLFLDADAAITKSNIWLIGNSNSLFIRTEIARRIGGFDESLGVGASTPFKSGEETDFLLRALATGARGFYRRDLLVHHDQAPVGGAGGVARAQDYARGFGRVLRLHAYGAPYLAMRVIRTSARAALALATGDMATARYKALWALGTFKGFIAPLPGREA
ncbi:MAG: glycosyltransferase family 2 protein [Rhodoblastus sp.]|nr:glycosyltransferase family 2 protein [Rhodoblastus sp.]